MLEFLQNPYVLFVGIALCILGLAIGGTFKWW